MKAPKQVVCLDRTLPVKRRKKVISEKEKVRGTYALDKGIDVERGPEELDTLKHELGHFVFEMCELQKEWRQRLGEDLAEQLEEQVMDKFLPLYRITLKQNGLNE